MIFLLNPSLEIVMLKIYLVLFFCNKNTVVHRIPVCVAINRHENNSEEKISLDRYMTVFPEF